MAGIPARPSIAAAVEPAKPPPMIAMSVYLMGDPALRHQFCAGKGKQTLKERGIVTLEVFLYLKGALLFKPFVVDGGLLAAGPTPGCKRDIEWPYAIMCTSVLIADRS